MALISTSTYEPPRLLTNGHLQTILPALFRTVNDVQYNREKINTDDGDFLDLDWAKMNSCRLVIISHGLEGSASKNYIKGMAKAMNDAGWDALAWNYRSCGGEPNCLPRAYHSGATEDLDAVVRHALKLGRYNQIALVGFSLGGNLTLKFIGEKGSRLESRVVAAVVISVPLDLASSSRRISNSKIYNERFLASLCKKIRAKAAQFPHEIDGEKLSCVKTLWEFDDTYTAPMHGFKNAEDYYRRCSSKFFLKTIAVPTLIVNALNDPFLPKECFPFNDIQPLKNVWFETPKYGGHIGFMRKGGGYWSESRTAEFLTQWMSNA